MGFYGWKDPIRVRRYGADVGVDADGDTNSDALVDARVGAGGDTSVDEAAAAVAGVDKNVVVSADPRRTYIENFFEDPLRVQKLVSF